MWSDNCVEVAEELVGVGVEAARKLVTLEGEPEHLGNEFSDGWQSSLGILRRRLRRPAKTRRGRITYDMIRHASIDTDAERERGLEREWKMCTGWIERLNLPRTRRPTAAYYQYASRETYTETARG